MEGLEASVLSVTEVIAENKKIRIDSGYFSKKALVAERLVESLPNYPFSDVTSVFRKGIFDIKAETYVEINEGIPFVRIGDLRGGLIQKSSTAWISKDAHRLELKTALSYSDLVVSKTAYPAASMVNLEECNVSQDTIAIRLNPFGKAKFKAGFIAAFLNTKQGHLLMARRFQGNVQQHLSLEDGKSIKIPLFGFALQNRVHEIVQDADRQSDTSSKKQKEAEGTLLEAIGLADWEPPEPLSYTARASTAFAAWRLDAQYFMPAKEQVRQSLAAMPGDRLGERMNSIRNMFVPDCAPATMKLRNYNVTDALVSLLDAEKEPSFASGIGSIKKTFKDGDVVISRLRAYLREIAVVSTCDDIPSIGSSEFIVLRPKKGQCDISPETLMVFLRSAPVQTVLKWCQKGSQHPRFSEGDLLSIPVPDAVAEVSGQITTIVKKGFAARRCARQLLEAAKRAVEIAIENGEADAMAFLNQADETS